MKISKSRLKEIINEEYRTVLSEQEIPTVGEAKALVGVGIGALISTGVGAGAGLALGAGATGAAGELGQEAFGKNSLGHLLTDQEILRKRRLVD
jgi:hypothetical protein